MREPLDSVFADDNPEVFQVLSVQEQVTMFDAAHKEVVLLVKHNDFSLFKRSKGFLAHVEELLLQQT